MVHASSPEILEILKSELCKVWGTNKGGNKMVDWSMKSHYDEVVMLPSGHLYCTEKPTIETSFCFGYNTDYSGHEHSDAIDRMSAFKKSEKAFKEANLRELNSSIENLERNGKEYDWQCAQPIIRPHYENSNIYCLNTLRPNNWDGEKFFLQGILPNGAEILTEEDKKVILETMKLTRTKFEKRLDTYLKKYGTSKLKTWTYWRDE